MPARTAFPLCTLPRRQSFPFVTWLRTRLLAPLV